MPGLQGLFETGVGLYNLIKGASMHPNRPDYEIPQEVKDQLALAQNELNSTMPGYNNMLQSIYQSQANTAGNLARGAQGSSSYLSGLMGLQGMTNNSLQRLGTTNAQSYQQRLENLNKAQDIMAQQKATQWQYNEYMPYMQELQRKYDLIGGGEQSINNGLGSLDQMAMFKQMMGSGGESGGLMGLGSIGAASPSGLSALGAFLV